MNEGLSEKMFISIIMKGLPNEKESVTTLVNFSKEEKVLEENKGDHINFDNENVKSESIFYNKEQKGFNYQKVGHIDKDCRFKKVNTKQIRGQLIKCFKCGERGHIAKFCKKQTPEKTLLGRAEILVKIISRGLRV